MSESNPGRIEGRKTRINTGFSTNGRIGRSPKDSEKERPEGPFWASEEGEKGVSRPKVGDAATGENEPASCSQYRLWLSLHPFGRQRPFLAQVAFLLRAVLARNSRATLNEARFFLAVSVSDGFAVVRWEQRQRCQKGHSRGENGVYGASLVR